MATNCSHCPDELTKFVADVSVPYQPAIARVQTKQTTSLFLLGHILDAQRRWASSRVKPYLVFLPSV